MGLPPCTTVMRPLRLVSSVPLSVISSITYILCRFFAQVKHWDQRVHPDRVSHLKNFESCINCLLQIRGRTLRTMPALVAINSVAQPVDVFQLAASLLAGSKPLDDASCAWQSWGWTASVHSPRSLQRISNGLSKRWNCKIMQVGFIQLPHNRFRLIPPGCPATINYLGWLLLFINLFGLLKFFHSNDHDT